MTLLTKFWQSWRSLLAPLWPSTLQLPKWTTLWNRGLPAHVRITHRIIWPLFLVPLALLNQIVTPHPIWIVVLVMVAGMYGLSYYWVRSQAKNVTLRRVRIGTLLVAGDALREEFELRNESDLPVLWAEFIDHSNLPNYEPGRVVACGGHGVYRWNSQVECRHRGVYQLGPHTLSLGDPFGLFTLQLAFDQTEVVLIYPRVAHLPPLVLPAGNAGGTARRRRPLWGALPSAGVREYQMTDSLRYIHWPITAHRGALMVKELEIEPSGACWIVLDLNEAAHSGQDEINTLEYSIIVAASIAAELLSTGERRAVGLLAVSGPRSLSNSNAMERPATDGATVFADAAAVRAEQSAILLSPQTGQAQLWQILATLAPVQATNVSLAELLRSSRNALGRRRTLVVITAQGDNFTGDQDWIAELVHLQSLGLVSSVVLVTNPQAEHSQAETTPEKVVAQGAAPEQLRSLLARYDIPMQTLQAGVRLPAALTFRRKRKVIRSTPSGGAVVYEVEEEVG
ncbi:MAG: DUF58 domain-containing protein [Chloroflexi bacterium]|nr:DUF58 domain-containing protein [Chloroflexota bacterium]